MSSKIAEITQINSSLKMEELEGVYEHAINSWMEGHKQIDDILLIGIKFKMSTIITNNNVLEDVAFFREKMNKHNFIFSYRGRMPHSMVKSLLSMTEKKLMH